VRAAAGPGLSPLAGPASVALGERFAATPRLACEALQRALNEGDLDTALACFCPEACLIAPDGTQVHGGVAIRSRLAGLIQSGGGVAIELAGVLAIGDIALAHERWTFYSDAGQSSSGDPHPTLVLRRLAGEWKLAIAAPWGWAPAAALEAVGAPGR
jgi:ketosteroid isomerase-like protein